MTNVAANPLTVMMLIYVFRGVEGAVTVSGSGGTGIPNQQALTLRCNYTVTPGDVVTGYSWKVGEGNSAVNVASGSVTAKKAVFFDSWQNKGVFVGDYTSSLDIQLPISHVTSSYAGTYSCQVNGLSGSGQVSVTAWVLAVPSISGLPSTYTVIESSRLRIDCSTYTTPGNPPTTSYTWTYGGSTVSTGPVLDRSSISRSQGGSYTCTASNTQGSDSASVNVDVQYAAHANLSDGIGSLGAHVIFLADVSNCCVLSWHSGKIKRVVRSTLAAEALSLQEGLEEGVYLRGVLADVIGVNVQMEAYVDNRSVVDAIHSTKMVDDKRLRIDLAAIRQLLDNGEVLKVCWCPGEYQLANCLTKRGASAHQLMTVLSSEKLSGFQ